MDALHNQSKPELVKEIIRLREVLADWQQEQPEPVLAAAHPTTTLHQDTSYLANVLHQPQKKAIPETDQNYRGIFNAHTEAIFVFSREGKMIDANQSASQLYQRKKEELVGLSVSEFSELNGYDIQVNY